MASEPITKKNIPKKMKHLINGKCLFIFWSKRVYSSFSRDRIYRVSVFRDFVKRIPTINTMLSGFKDDPAKLEDFINAVSGYMRLYAQFFCCILVTLGHQLRSAASLARAEDTCKLKDLCPSFLLEDPSRPGATLDRPISKVSQSRYTCFRAYIDLVLNREKRPPSFKKLPSYLYDEALADPKLKRSRFLRGKPLERVFSLLTL
jgi:hypothetical protein